MVEMNEEEKCFAEIKKYSGLLVNNINAYNQQAEDLLRVGVNANNLRAYEEIVKRIHRATMLLPDVFKQFKEVEGDFPEEWKQLTRAQLVGDHDMTRLLLRVSEYQHGLTTQKMKEKIAKLENELKK